MIKIRLTQPAKLFVIFASVLLLYLIMPGPENIDDFPELPGSIKSKLEGDTIQIPNISAYFSNHYRAYVTNFYSDSFQANTWFPLAPLRLNYPPEQAFIAIKDQTQSTYLEEFVYPLRESLYVNGMEPFRENGKPKYWGATKFEFGATILDTKATLRYYPSPLYARLVTWLGINLSIYLLWGLGKKVFSRG